jgi:hypothetical protein
LARATPQALGEELFAETQKKFSAKKKTLGEEFFAESQIFFKKSLFHFPNFSILNMHLYKAYVQI